MTTAQQSTSGSGWFSKLVVVLLLGLAIGLYLQIVMVDGNRQANEPAPQASEPAPQASVRVVESNATEAVAAKPGLQDLPQAQMDLIKRVFAPETLN
ncbi:MAG: hypothetical protein LJE59_10735 [Chromatiaceae bacterium]|jgi:hypothetical protein|nr:hypothetical protein [Chromatiaceae bacterium]